MSKTKALNALPNTLAQMYFSSYAYYQNGYMADHLWNAAATSGILEARLDILKGTAEPGAFSQPAILSYLPELRAQIHKELEHLGFDQDQVSEVFIDIFVSKKHAALRLLTGCGTIVTKDGRRIKGKAYTETASALRESGTVKKEAEAKPWWKIW